MKNDQDILAARCAEDLHDFYPCDDPFHRNCCKVTGPSGPKHIQVDGSYEASEKAARKLIREISDLDVRPAAPSSEIDFVRRVVRRVA